MNKTQCADKSLPLQARIFMKAKFKKESSKNTYIEQSTDRPNCIKFQSSNLKRTSGMQRNSKSIFGRLCAYLMRCDTHLRDIYTKNIPAKFQKYLKYFSSYRADKLCHTDGETDGRMEGQTGDAAGDNTNPALGLTGPFPTASSTATRLELCNSLISRPMAGCKSDRRLLHDLQLTR